MWRKEAPDSTPELTVETSIFELLELYDITEKEAEVVRWGLASPENFTPKEYKKLMFLIRNAQQYHGVYWGNTIAYFVIWLQRKIHLPKDAQTLLNFMQPLMKQGKGWIKK